MMGRVLKWKLCCIVSLLLLTVTCSGCVPEGSLHQVDIEFDDIGVEVVNRGESNGYINFDVVLRNESEYYLRQVDLQLGFKCKQGKGNGNPMMTKGIRGGTVRDMEPKGVLVYNVVIPCGLVKQREFDLDKPEVCIRGYRQQISENYRFSLFGPVEYFLEDKEMS